MLNGGKDESVRTALPLAQPVLVPRLHAAWSTIEGGPPPFPGRFPSTRPSTFRTSIINSRCDEARGGSKRARPGASQRRWPFETTTRRASSCHASALLPTAPPAVRPFHPITMVGPPRRPRRSLRTPRRSALKSQARPLPRPQITRPAHTLQREPPLQPQLSQPAYIRQASCVRGDR